MTRGVGYTVFVRGQMISSYSKGREYWDLYMRTRSVQDTHHEKAPRLVKHSGTRQQEAVLVGGPKVGYLEWCFACISSGSPPFLSFISSLSRDL